MKYAVVKIGGSQYKVQEGKGIIVDRLPQKEGEPFEITEVLLLVDDQVKIGQPTLSDIQIKAKILGHEKGEKIRVAKFKAKSRYRKVTGFRASLTRVMIEQIGGKMEKEKVEKKVEKKSAPKKTSAAK
ncbi:MAG: 50S ribosomal protein L21 [bacterium]|nr:50S ribosomal protein L21 [bacterium]